MPATEPRRRRSVSRLLDYIDCGLKYKILHVDKSVPDLPAWWNVGGSSFHAGVREWELHRLALGPEELARRWTADYAALRFRTLFGSETDKLLAESGIAPAQWRTANKGIEGRDWWLDKGPEMLVQYTQRSNARRERLLMLGADAPVLELDFVTELGGVPVRMIIDQALYDPARQRVILRDLKSGSRLPTDPLQLHAYALGLISRFGEAIRLDAPGWSGEVVGDYWHTRKHMATGERVLDTSPAGFVQVGQRFADFDRAESAGVYLPRPSSFCSSCSAKSVCPIMSTHKSNDEKSLRFDA